MIATKEQQAANLAEYREFGERMGCIGNPLINELMDGIQEGLDRVMDRHAVLGDRKLIVAATKACAMKLKAMELAAVEMGIDLK